MMGVWRTSSALSVMVVLSGLSRAAAGTEPTTSECLSAYDDEVQLAAGADQRLDRAAGRLRDELAHSEVDESSARRLVEQLAIVLQGALLVRFGHPAVTDAFAASRLSGDWGHAFGTLPRGVDVRTIVDRATPKLG